MLFKATSLVKKSYLCVIWLFHKLLHLMRLANQLTIGRGDGQTHREVGSFAFGHETRSEEFPLPR